LAAGPPGTTEMMKMPPCCPFAVTTDGGSVAAMTPK
jgi:hypothetical protein